MADDCCKLVGNFFNETGFTFNEQWPGCFISVNANINTEYTDYSCDDMLGGATVGSLNLSGYADNIPYTGCPGQASCQILWTRKYDCENDTTHFIFSGEGRSFFSGDADDYVTLNRIFPNKTRLINASSQSGPHTVYTDMEQTEGLGMTYSKGPISFNSSTETGSRMENMGIGTGFYYLQNFRIDLVPGSIPVANYTFAFNP